MGGARAAGRAGKGGSPPKGMGREGALPSSHSPQDPSRSTTHTHHCHSRHFPPCPLAQLAAMEKDYEEIAADSGEGEGEGEGEAEA